MAVGASLVEFASTEAAQAALLALTPAIIPVVGGVGLVSWGWQTLANDGRRRRDNDELYKALVEMERIQVMAIPGQDGQELAGSPSTKTSAAPAGQ